MKEVYSIHNPVRINFGRECRGMLQDRLKAKEVLIVCSARGRKEFTRDSKLSVIGKCAKLTWVDNIKSNPDIDLLQSVINKLSSKHYDLVLGFGGGSAMDAAKVVSMGISPIGIKHGISALIENPELHRTEVSVPCITVPTTSGTGSDCLLYTSPSPRDATLSRMPSSA